MSGKTEEKTVRQKTLVPINEERDPLQPPIDQSAPAHDPFDSTITDSPTVVSIPDKRIATITVSMERDYGVTKITFSKTTTVFVSSVLEQTAEYDKLTAQLDYQHEHFALEKLTKLKNLAPPKSDPEVKDTLQWYIARQLIREIVDGEERWKIRTTTGEYAKYGSPVYDEEQKTYGLRELMGDRYLLDLPETCKVGIEKRQKGSAVKKIVGLP